MYGAWLLGAAQSELLVQGRLLLPVLPFLAVLLAGALPAAGRLDLPFLRTHVFLHTAVLLALSLATVTHAFSWVADPPVPYLAGSESRAGYQRRHLGEHARALEFVNGSLPSGSSVFFLWEPRTYLCQVPCQADALLFNWRYLLATRYAASEIHAALRERGYTHLLLNGAGLRYFSEPPHVELEAGHLAALQDLEDGYLELVSGPSLREVLKTEAAPPGGTYSIYRLRAGG